MGKTPEWKESREGESACVGVGWKWLLVWEVEGGGETGTEAIST